MHILVEARMELECANWNKYAYSNLYYCLICLSLQKVAGNENMGQGICRQLWLDIVY